MHGLAGMAVLFPYATNETQAFVAQRLDQALILAAVADRGAGRIDAAGQRGFGNRSAAPDRVEDFVLGNDPIAIANQILKQVENLRLDGDKLACAPQFAPLRIEYAVFEAKEHVYGRHRRPA